MFRDIWSCLEQDLDTYVLRFFSHRFWMIAPVRVTRAWTRSYFSKLLVDRFPARASASSGDIIGTPILLKYSTSFHFSRGSSWVRDIFGSLKLLKRSVFWKSSILAADDIVLCKVTKTLEFNWSHEFTYQNVESFGVSSCGRKSVYIMTGRVPNSWHRRAEGNFSNCLVAYEGALCLSAAKTSAELLYHNQCSMSVRQFMCRWCDELM